MVVRWAHPEVDAVCPEEMFLGLRALVVNAEGSGFEAPVQQVLYQPRLSSHQLLGCVVFQRFGQDGVAVVVVQNHH